MQTIPYRFAENFRDKIQGTIKLKACNEHASSSEDDQETLSASSYVFSPYTTRLTEVHRIKVEEKVRAVHSNYPVFVAVMTKSNIIRQPCYLAICRKYANKYLPRKEQMLTLQRQGRRWQVQFRINKRNLRMLSNGWRKFTRDNELQIGDTCLFELLSNKNSYTMNVQIIRKYSLLL
ncbi:hypothetical protein E2562_020641 [Oryza meyeriana var. granulata]|uniref:TF-B3 domain-containing protein n=1 Tax=Oryza meyeriana var. granulata TaxID=110450 RepID=A0A6G1EBW1_9ORYZ|nr:hypothetical protein E2562_020641 [Oryza meyeriana var. granulata]